MRRALALGWAAVLGLVAPPDAPPARAEDAPAERTADDVATDVTWSGVVRLSRRIRVHAGATLRIAAGTRVVVPSVDVPGVDRKAAMVPGIEVSGSLVAEGTAASPIVLGPPPPDPERPPHGRPPPAWFGVLAMPIGRGAQAPSPAPRFELAHCTFERAFAGVQAGRSAALLRSCVFHLCTAGVEVGELWEARDRYIGPAGEVAPRLEDCRFGTCRIGVAVEGEGRPELDRCLFAGCGLGTGNDGPFGVIHPLRSLGPRVERCEFVRCERAVYGPSSVTRCVFEWNDLVFEPSVLHDEFTTQIDRYVRAHNLYGPAQTLTRSDVPLGDGALFAPPDRRGRFAFPATVEALSGDLAPLLGLESGSIGHPADAGGATVGLFAQREAALGASPDSGAPRGLLVGSWLSAGPAAPSDLPDVDALAKAIGAKGRFAGDLDALSAGGAIQWAVVPPAGSPEAARRAPDGRARILLAVLDSARDGGATLHLGWDGDLAAWWNGKPLATPSGRRRFRPGDATASLSRVKGPNVLVLRHEARASANRLDVLLLDPLRKDGPPADLAVAPLVRPDAEAAPVSIRSATWHAPRGANPFVRIVFTGPVHWADASIVRSYAISDASGRPVDLSGTTFAYQPADRTVDLTPSSPLGRGSYRLTCMDLRAPDGTTSLASTSTAFAVR
jgi:hypothetical protein